MVNHESDVATIMNGYKNYELNDMQAKSIRSVMRNHTTYHRLDEIFSYIDKKPSQKEMLILVVVDKKTPEMEEILRRQLNVNFDVIEQNESIAEQEKYDFITFMNDSIQY